MFCHRSEVMTDVMEAGAILFGSPTLNNGILPRMADILSYMKGLKPLGRIGGVFGSYGWSGESTKILENALNDMNIELAAPGVKVNYVPSDDDLKVCYEYGRQIAQALKSRLQK